MKAPIKVPPFREMNDPALIAQAVDAVIRDISARVQALEHSLTSAAITPVTMSCDKDVIIQPGQLIHASQTTGAAPLAQKATAGTVGMYATHICVQRVGAGKIIAYPICQGDICVNAAAATAGDPRLFLSITPGIATFSTSETGALFLQQVGYCLLDSRSTRNGKCTGLFDCLHVILL